MHEPADIDRTSPVAPYRQVAAILMRQIESGEYAPGQRLPARDDLMHIYGIAKETAAKALRVLRDEGYAEMSQGLGTFVREDFPRGHTGGT